jgi:hypothetical protein
MLENKKFKDQKPMTVSRGLLVLFTCFTWNISSDSLYFRQEEKVLCGNKNKEDLMNIVYRREGAIFDAVLPTAEVVGFLA